MKLSSGWFQSFVIDAFVTTMLPSTSSLLSYVPASSYRTTVPGGVVTSSSSPTLKPWLSAQPWSAST
jgi:hypothetical protein